jgi:kinesin family protein 11
MFEKMVDHMKSQKAEVNELRAQLLEANGKVIDANQEASSELQKALDEERSNAEVDRANLLSQMKLLIEDSGQRQATRLQSRVESIRSGISSSGDTLKEASNNYQEQMDQWINRENELVKEVTDSRDALKSRMQEDWTVSSTRAPGIFNVLTNPRSLKSVTHQSRRQPSLSTRKLFVSSMLRWKGWQARWKLLTSLSQRHDLRMVSIMKHT